MIRPYEAKGDLLDVFLENAFYRAGASLFTQSKYQPSETEVYPVAWLRYDVRNLKPGNSSRKTIKQNKQFTISISPFCHSAELEDLHCRYWGYIDFETAPTIAEQLEDTQNRIFDTGLIEVRDGKKLIAAGLFDQGKNSIAGIKNIFDPEYARFSLGKYLMLLKYYYCQENAIRWYYPGYIIPGYPKFDYKLFLDCNATWVYDYEECAWIPYRSYVPPNQERLRDYFKKIAETFEVASETDRMT